MSPLRWPRCLVVLLGVAVLASEAGAGPAWTERSRGTWRGAQWREVTFTSQVWQGAAWQHQLFIVVPPRLPGGAPPGRPALLLVAGGEWRPRYASPPRKPRTPEGIALYAALARRLEAPVAVLLQVPNQPLFGGMTEDDLMAFSFERYLDTRDPSWPLLLPMVESARRAMDVVTDVAADQWRLPVQQFLVTGGSKRGWTAWLAAAADPRIVALAPVVIDLVNVRRQLAHQQWTWGGPPPEMRPYIQRDLPRRLASPEGEPLLRLIDPWYQRERITQPKLIVLATNDGYWPADSLGLYVDGLVGPRSSLYLPNEGHTPRNLPRLLDGLAALQRSVVTGRALPELTAEYAMNGSRAELRVRVGAGEAPRRARAWFAPVNSRDLRAGRWTARAMRRLPDGSYLLRIPVANGGYLGLFGEVDFGAGRERYSLATGLRLLGEGGVVPLAPEPGSGPVAGDVAARR
ncbi:MAG: PhoPQ-activated protein PqaA family protein [Gammaproteobacteria bacterium]